MQNRTRALLTSALLALAAAAALSGCSADAPLNPSFPLLAEEARDELRAMRADRLPPSRPVVVIGGLFDVGFSAAALGRSIAALLAEGSPMVVITLFATSSTDDARERIIAVVDRAWPSGDPLWTTEVDVVAFSMGGVVARDAAAPPPPPPPTSYESPAAHPPRRLRIARLFTIGSPHSGANAAAYPAIDDRVLALRSGSDFLTTLAEREARAGDHAYDVFAYVCLGDAVVGTEHAGLNGDPPFWVAPMPLSFPHISAYRDPRIIADIGRRLRGEPGYATHPAAPVPTRSLNTPDPEPVLTAP